MHDHDTRAGFGYVLTVGRVLSSREPRLRATAPRHGPIGSTPETSEDRMSP